MQQSILGYPWRIRKLRTIGIWKTGRGMAPPSVALPGGAGIGAAKSPFMNSKCFIKPVRPRGRWRRPHVNIPGAHLERGEQLVVLPCRVPPFGCLISGRGFEYLVRRLPVGTYNYA